MKVSERVSTLHRNRSEELEYRRRLKSRKGNQAGCVFCDANNPDNKIIEEYALFTVINNLFPYTLWDSCKVVEHFMIVPKRHVDSVSEFNADEIAEYHTIAASYEGRGYDLYSRGRSSTMKSVPHQHTHLIKTDGVKIKGLIYHERPLIHITY